MKFSFRIHEYDPFALKSDLKGMRIKIKQMGREKHVSKEIGINFYF